MTRTRDSLPLRYRAYLSQQINDRFGLGELKSLCFDLGVSFDDLSGPTKTNRVEDLVSRFERSSEIPRLIAYCEAKRPRAEWQYQARVFICYKRHAETDSALAHYLARKLSEQGHLPFIDKTMRVGTEWLDEIDRQLRESDFLIVLLSNDSADSEMVQQEVYRAYEYFRTQGWPRILPIRICFEGMLPYSIAAFINARQYLVWESEEDNQKVLEELLGALQGDVLERSLPVDPSSVQPVTLLAEDGRPKRDHLEVLPPLPEFDPRLLTDLPAPGGTMRISDRLYIEREADFRLRNQLALAGTITTIRASRQTGKSSLLVRGVHSARQAGAKVVCLDLQSVDSDDLASSDTFLSYLAYFIVNRLHLDIGHVERFWDIPLGAQDRLTALLEEYVLASLDRPMVLAIDEADRLLETNFYSDFFGLLRAWHNSAAYEPAWEKMNLAMVISTEPYLLISDPNQSPFNVGLKLYLDDFTESQVQDLNQRHGSVVAPDELAEFLKLLGGHPYLSRKAMYTMTTERMNWPRLRSIAASDTGPFSDHLRRQMWLLHQRPELVAALRAVIRRQQCDNEDARFRLLRAGLIQASGELCTPRCELYEIYFRDRLI